MSRTTARIILAVIGVIFVLAMAHTGGLVDLILLIIAVCAFFAILFFLMYLWDKAFYND